MSDRDDDYEDGDGLGFMRGAPAHLWRGLAEGSRAAKAEARRAYAIGVAYDMLVNEDGSTDPRRVLAAALDIEKFLKSGQLSAATVRSINDGDAECPPSTPHTSTTPSS